MLDEFDKSLEVGFEDEMSELVLALSNLEKKILTSATQGVEMPAFVGIRKPLIVNHLDVVLASTDHQIYHFAR